MKTTFIVFIRDVGTELLTIFLMEDIPLWLCNIKHYEWIIIYWQLNFKLHRDQFADFPLQWIWLVMYFLDLLGHACFSWTAVWKRCYKNFPSSVYTWKASGTYLCYCGIFHVCVFMLERNVRPSAARWKFTETLGLQASPSRILSDRKKECICLCNKGHAGVLVTL